MGDKQQHSQILTGKLRQTLFWLALPVFGEQLLNSGVAFVDTYLAGRISADATSAIGLAAYVDWLASMLFALVGTGTTALVARSIGSKKPKEANRFANQSITLSVITGVAVSLLLFMLAPAFARLQNMDGEAYEIAVRYLRLDALALTFTSLTLVGAAGLRGSGDMRTPMLVLGAVNVLNAGTSFAFVHGWGPFPNLGVDGIVAGTVIGRVGGGLLMTAVLWKGRSGLRFSRAQLRLQREPVRRLLAIGGPAATDGAILWSGHFLFLMIVARLAEGELGRAYYAAHIIGVRLEALTYLPATAWAAAAATMIGQNLGAGDATRAKQAGHEAALQCGLLTALVGAGFWLFATELFEVMHRDQIVRDAGIGPFRLIACFQPLLACSIVYMGALRGAGDTRFPLLITTFTLVVFRLPLGYALGMMLGMGLWGVWIAMCVDFVIKAILSFWRFAGGKWSRLKV